MSALATAKERLNLYLEAETTVLVNQSYKIGTREYTRANLNAIRDGIKYWQGKVDELERAESGRGRNRMYRFVPRDL
jgi:hypothetical protein